MTHVNTSPMPPIINILLVDDDEDDYQFFKHAITEQLFNCNLERVMDGENLMNSLNSENFPLPDMIFLDIRMPRKDGCDILCEIKGLEKLENIPIIIYSSSYNLEIADKLFQLGANFFIKKPVAFNDLKNVIQKALCFITQNISYKPTRENFLMPY